jgi:PKD repeat protein
MNFIPVILISIMVITGCNRDNDNTPVTRASFSVTGYETAAPATLNFINTSSNATSYRWDFGDNTFSTEQQPAHTYNFAGSYAINLKVTGPGGSDSVCKIVSIDPAVIANRSSFSYFLDKCTGYPVGAAFKSLNPASTNTVWDFNGVLNTSRDPIIQFLVPGDYTIKYSSQINGVRDTAIRIIRIQ